MIHGFLDEIYVNFTYNLDEILETNLLITAIGRIIFIIAFLVNYFTIINSKREKFNTCKECTKLKPAGWGWFIGKEIIFLGLGLIHISVTIIIVAYSVLAAGLYIMEASRRSEKKIAKVMGYILGTFLNPTIPVIAIIAFGYMFVMGTDPNAFESFIGSIIGSGIFSIRLIIGRIISNKRAPEILSPMAFKKSKRSFTKKVPRSVKVSLAIAIIASPAALFLIIDNTVATNYWTEDLEVEPGIFLSTDIYRKKSASGPQPVILIRTPYNKGSLFSESNEFIQDFLQQGYTVVYQDMRGRFDSPGTHISFLYDYNDGRVTLNWILNQSWCNGKIATWGGSALAITQYTFADEDSGALKFQTLTVGAPEIYDHMIFQGGAFRKSMIESWLYLISSTNQPLRPAEYSTNLEWFETHPIKNDSWNNLSLIKNDRYAQVNVSALHVGGWYDIFSQGTIDGFIGYDTRGGTYAQGKQKLVMGPNGHGKFGEIPGLDYIEFPEADESRHAGWETEMRNAALKGTYINWSEPRVAYYLMGDVDNPTNTANKWYYADNWPVTHTNTTYYIDDNGNLTTVPPAGNANFSYLYDPSNPVRTRGGNNLMGLYASLDPDALGVNGWPGDPDLSRVEEFVGIGPYDQTANLARDDVLVFSSNVLSMPMTITGRIYANLSVASNCTDTAFTVMLLDEYPDGKSYNILDGILVMRARNGYDQTAPDMIEGSSYQIMVDLWSTAYQFNTGHRIKIAISSSNYPRFERHPNNSDPFSNSPDNLQIANNTIISINSSIILPTVAL